MATDFNKVRQLVTALLDIQAMQAAFAQPGAQSPVISISFVIDHPAVGDPTKPAGDPTASPPVPPYVPASAEPFAFNFALPADVAGSAATSLGTAVTAAMAAMGLPTS